MDALEDLYLLFITKVSKHSDKLSKFLPKDFTSTSWKIILSRMEEKRKRKMRAFCHNQPLQQMCLDDSNSSVCEFCTFSPKEVSSDENYISLQQTVYNDENPLLPLSLNAFEEEGLKELSLITSPDDLAQMLNNLFKEMVIVYFSFLYLNKEYKKY